MPMTATAQIGPNDVIGSMSSVTGPVYIERAGQVLKVMNDSAVVAGDRIVAENGGSAMLTAASNVGGAVGGSSFPSIGTAMSSRTLLALLGAGVAGYGLYSIIDDNDDDDEPASP